MPTKNIRDHYYMKYTSRSEEKYWPEIYDYIHQNFGPGPYTGISSSKSIISDCYLFFCKKFQEIIDDESRLEFYVYVFDLMEESLLIWEEHLSQGKNTGFTSYAKFAAYQRPLYLILESAIDLNLFSYEISLEEINLMVSKIEDLLFLGEWIYTFASIYAEINVSGDCFIFTLTDSFSIDIQRKKPYNIIHDQLVGELKEGHLGRRHFRELEIEFQEKVASYLGVNVKESLSVLDISPLNRKKRG